MRYILVVLTFTALSGCRLQEQSEFDQTSKALSVRPHVAQALLDFQANRGGDNKAHFELLRAFCVRRQLAGPRDRYPELADPILDIYSLTTLLGSPDAHTEDGAWLYFFNPEKDWHLELSFRDGVLFHTSYRQLISAENLGKDIRQPTRF